MVYKALNGKAPDYIRDMLKCESNCYYGLRSNSHDRLICPKTSNRTHGDRAFVYAGPHFWNKLPQHVKKASSVDIFKKKLKTHLFNAAYN
jgi:hypothetical protein